MKTVRQHLLDRHLNIDLHRPVIDEDERIATFYIWNLSGQLIGYQQYRPDQTYKKTNDPRSARYFTYVHQPTLILWGLESLYLRDDVIFITEGIFDAARLISLGFPATAVLSCDAKRDTKNWFNMFGTRRRIAVCDNDENGSGKKLAKFGREHYFLESKDLGDSSDKEVFEFLNKIGFVL